MRTLIILGTILNQQTVTNLFTSLLKLTDGYPIQISVTSDSRKGLVLAGLAHIDNRHFNLIIWDLTTTGNERFKGANILAMPLDFNPKCKIVAITKPEDEEGRRIAKERSAHLALGRLPTQQELEKIMALNLS